MTNLHSAVCNYTGGLAVQAVDNNADKWGEADNVFLIFPRVSQD
jgi:hypothetical protein